MLKVAESVESLSLYNQSSRTRRLQKYSSSSTCSTQNAQDWEISSCSLCWSRREPLKSLPKHPRSCPPSPVFYVKEEESILYIHANGDVSHNDRKRKGSVNHVIMSVTLARPLKTLTLISSGWTVTAYNRIYIDLGLWCCDWCWLDNFGFFQGV